MAVALNATVPAQLLAELANDRDFEVVLKVAKHPNTPIETIIELASRGHPELRAEVARNPSTPVSLLDELAHDRESYTRALLARNPSTPPLTLAKLASGEIGVRRQVAANPNTPPRTLHLLATVPQTKPPGCDQDFDCALSYQLTSDSEIKAAVAANPAAALDTLVALAGRTDRLVLGSVCANPNTPPEALARAGCEIDRKRTSRPTPAPPVQMWGQWQHRTVVSEAVREAGWQSLRIVGGEYALGATLVDRAQGVHCLMSYHPVEMVPESPTVVSVVFKDVKLSLVKVFPNLSQGRTECRVAIETRAGLDPVPVSVATEHDL